MTLDILYKERDRIISYVVDQMDYGTNDHISELISSAITKISPGTKHWRTGFIQDIMIEENLIIIIKNDERGHIVSLTTHGVLIKMAGGWLNHLDEKKSKKWWNDFIKWTTLGLSFTATAAAIVSIFVSICTRDNTSDKYSPIHSERLQYQDPKHKETQMDTLLLTKPTYNDSIPK